MNAGPESAIPRPDLEAIRAAASRIGPYVHRTPIKTCETLNGMVGAELFFKCENFQKTGAFKFRGACNTVLSLSEDEAKRGVITHSSGNHAQAVALAAKTRGVSVCIVMPDTAPAVKRSAVEGYGAAITLCEPTMAARESTTADLVAETDAVLVHPYNDHRIIAGAGTAALELLEEVEELDTVMTPIGGGGLACGTSLVAHGLSPRTRVIAVEAEGAADASRSIEAGRIIRCENPNTIADGLLMTLGDLTFPIIREYVHAIVPIDDNAIVSAMRLVWERMKIIIEPSAAVTVAALLAGKVDAAGKRIGVFLTGGNVDFDKLPW
jgi:threonine dehydratase